MTRSWQWSLWGAAAALAAPLIIGAWLLFVPDAAARTMAGDPAGRGRGSAASPRPLDSLMTVARRTAPFRPDGRPSRVAYDPSRNEVTPDYTPPKPVLVLTGVMGGAAPLAVLEGIPGHDGPALLGVGDTLAGLKVRRILEGIVTIAGMDTTWVLTIRRLP
jgi:hypothetical protein